MLSSRRGGWVWILRLVSAVELSTNFSTSHPLSADGINGRPGLRRIGWSSANVAHTRRHRVKPFRSTVWCGDPLLGRQNFCTTPDTMYTIRHWAIPKDLLDGAWLAPFIFKPVGLFDI